MIPETKITDILVRKKAALRATCGCGDGCPKCAEEFELYLKMAEANLPIKYWDKSFDDFDAGNAGIKERVTKYCANFPKRLEKGMGLFLVGANGVGKTLTACMILKEATRHGYKTRFTSLTEIVTMSADGLYNQDARLSYQKKLIDVDFLVIDDITKTYKNTDKKSSTYIDLQFDQLFRARANACLPVIVTSNHTREEALKSADEVLSSSLLSLFAEHLTDITFVGKDRRNNVGAQGSSPVSH